MTASRAKRAVPFSIGGHVVHPGERVRFDLPVAMLPTHTQLHIPVAVVNGLAPGPTLLLSAAIHGDELNGIEIIGRVLDEITELKRGVILAVPIVNVFGFIGNSRYLPDGRDLNRSFPGSSRGSLASRVAHLFMTEIVHRCTHGIDLHTATSGRSNLPQIRGDLSDPETRRIAEAFAAPAMILSPTRPKSLRSVAAAKGIPLIVFEGGEALRFNAPTIGVGVRGVFGVMRELGMISRSRARRRPTSSYIEESTWIRARRGGLVRLTVDLGALVAEDEEIGVVADPFGEESVPIVASYRGLVIGMTKNPVVHLGDPLVHIGKLPDAPSNSTP